MTITCDGCDEEMTSPGGLAFAPPIKRATLKYHICVRCWPSFIAYLLQTRRPGEGVGWKRDIQP